MLSETSNPKWIDKYQNMPPIIAQPKRQGGTMKAIEILGVVAAVWLIYLILPVVTSVLMKELNIWLQVAAYIYSVVVFVLVSSRIRIRPR